MPKLFLSTTGADVVIPELGISIIHPATDYEIDAQFSAEDLALASSLTTAINNGSLVWKKTAGGSAQPPTDYDPDYLEAEELSGGSGNLNQQLVKSLGSSILSLKAQVQATVAGTLVLTRGTSTVLIFTGTTAGQIIQLPGATTLDNGHYFEVWNVSTESIVVKNAGGGTLFTIGQTSTAYIKLQDNTTSNGLWVYWQVFVSALAAGILNYTLTSGVNFITASTSDTIITGFTVTPQAGLYAAWFSCDVTIATNNRLMDSVLYIGGVENANTRRTVQGVSSNFRATSSVIGLANVNGSQAVDVWVKSSGGNITVGQRSLVLIRLGTNV
jgi:hypothetical protein